MTTHKITQLDGEGPELAFQEMEWLENLRRNFDAEVQLPAEISREFLSAALLWATEKKVDFGLFHEADKIIIAHFGGDEVHLPSRWSDKRWHIGLEDREQFFVPDEDH